MVDEDRGPSLETVDELRLSLDVVSTTLPSNLPGSVSVEFDFEVMELVSHY